MHKCNIILNCWYQESPNDIQEEIYLNLTFDCFEDAVKRLNEDIEEIMDWYPVQTIEIRYTPVEN